MNSVFAFLAKIFIGRQDSYNLNMPVLIIVLTSLLIALGICIVISKKNRLYLRPKRKNKRVQI